MPDHARPKALARHPADPSKLIRGTLANGALTLTPAGNADANGDGASDALDLFFLINELFA